MKFSVGTRAWAIETSGTLANRDRQRLIAQAMLSRIAAMPQRWRSQLGWTRQGMSRINLDTVRLPDTTVARQATELVSSLSKPWLVNHCIRTYFWGSLLAQSTRIRFDEELLYVASVMHDLGLTDEHGCHAEGAACFAVAGARAAEKFAHDAGWAEERCHRLYEAISLHLNIRVALKHGAEAHLLHEGAVLDLVGARAKELGPQNIQQVVQQYPRHGFKAEITASMKEQARLTPQSRAALLLEMGVSQMIRRAPMPD